jgi:hypothetical protein
VVSQPPLGTAEHRQRILPRIPATENGCVRTDPAVWPLAARDEQDLAARGRDRAAHDPGRQAALGAGAHGARAFVVGDGGWWMGLVGPSGADARRVPYERLAGMDGWAGAEETRVGGARQRPAGVFELGRWHASTRVRWPNANGDGRLGTGGGVLKSARARGGAMARALALLSPVDFSRALVGCR